ncbi:ERF family protein [Leuconostoc falkenbergense]|uniref:ERF family protein n=1 Tax=Leuconostoc pseudomesenteroides TaxID=33968 RepID=UPI0039E86FE1
MRQVYEVQPTAELNAAFGKLQQHLKQPDKTKTGVHGAKYADLYDVGNAIRKANTESNAGISFTQPIISELDANGRERLQVLTIIMHESGEKMVVEGLPLTAGSNNSQEAMKAATYAKRGSLMAAFGITPKDEDDDGEEITALQQYQNRELEQKRMVQAKVKQMLALVDKTKLDLVWASIGAERGSINDVDKLSMAKASMMYGAIKFANADLMSELGDK